MLPKDPHNHQLRLHWYSRLMNWYRWNDAVQIPLFNSVARLALRGKYAVDRLHLAFYLQYRQEKLAQWQQQTQFFFVLASPRSGTVFLTDLLLSQKNMAQVEHEANITDYLAYAEAIQSSEAALAYIQNFRRQDMFWRSRGNGKRLYGEVNPFLSLHAKALQQCFSQAQLFHLVKDGRTIVRSMFSRSKLGAKDPMAKPIFPPLHDAYHDRWDKMGRFEKICWQWQFENRYLREQIENRLYFEQLSSDYTYFKTHFLEKMGFEVSETEWKNYINSPKNESPIYRMPHHSAWSSEEKAIFERICGDEMRALGYW